MIGVDPRPFTLRLLTIMARGRRLLEGQLLGFQLSKITQLLSGATIDPELLNPYSEVERPEKTQEQLDLENEAGWRLLDIYFTGEPGWTTPKRAG